MKKVLVALAMVLGTGSSVVFAQEVNNSSAVVAEAQVPQDEFVKMDPTELPQAILLTLAKNYEGSSVKEAYVKVKDEAKIYKIIILTQDGLVIRNVYAEVPPRVEYSLTEMGHSLMPHIESLVGWALEHMADILERRGVQQEVD